MHAASGALAVVHSSVIHMQCGCWPTLLRYLTDCENIFFTSGRYWGHPRMSRHYCEGACGFGRESLGVNQKDSWRPSTNKEVGNGVGPPKPEIHDPNWSRIQNWWKQKYGEISGSDLSPIPRDLRAWPWCCAFGPLTGWNQVSSCIQGRGRYFPFAARITFTPSY